MYNVKDNNKLVECNLNTDTNVEKIFAQSKIAKN